MREKILRVRPNCDCINLGLILEQDPYYGRAYVTDVTAKSSAGYIF